MNRIYTKRLVPVNQRVFRAFLRFFRAAARLRSLVDLPPRAPRIEAALDVRFTKIDSS
jgi:hypothetical protein